MLEKDETLAPVWKTWAEIELEKKLEQEKKLELVSQRKRVNLRWKMSKVLGWKKSNYFRNATVLRWKAYFFSNTTRLQSSVDTLICYGGLKGPTYFNFGFDLAYGVDTCNMKLY